MTYSLYEHYINIRITYGIESAVLEQSKKATEPTQMLFLQSTFRHHIQFKNAMFFSV